MKTLIPCLAILSLLNFSCNKVDTKVDPLENGEPKYNIILQDTVFKLKNVGDIKYDVLGNGYDITGNKNDIGSVRATVINMRKFFLEQRNRIDTGFITSSYFETFAGGDARKYIDDLSLNTDYSYAVKPFNGSITNFFKTDKDYSQYSFASIDWLNERSHLSLYADTTMLANYLDVNFIADLQTKTADQIVEIYGTHVLTDIKTGGKVHMLYRSVINEANKREIVINGASFALKRILGFVVSGPQDYSLSVNNKQAYASISVVGGTQVLFPVAGEFDPSKSTQLIYYGDWAISVNSGKKRSAVFISADHKKSIPIYELVTNITKKNELKLAVENYINKSKI
jgi:hypothetical protein